MIFDDKGLPRDTGATDFMDSSRLAGMVRLFDDKSKIPIDLYVRTNMRETKKYVRYPFVENPYDFSRDQTLCLVAGLYKAGFSFLVNKDYVTGKDIFMPSHMGHLNRCAKKPVNLLQKAWLWIDVLYSTFVKPVNEPNQILAMMYIAYLQGEKSYLKFWLKHNTKWKQSIKDYWELSFRDEKELSALIIAKLEQIK